MRRSETVKKGASRMIELGYKQVQVWLDKHELSAVEKKIAREGSRERIASLARRLLCEYAEHNFYRR